MRPSTVSFNNHFVFLQSTNQQVEYRLIPLEMRQYVLHCMCICDRGSYFEHLYMYINFFFHFISHIMRNKHKLNKKQLSEIKSVPLQSEAFEIYHSGLKQNIACFLFDSTLTHYTHAVQLGRISGFQASVHKGSRSQPIRSAFEN